MQFVKPKTVELIGGPFDGKVFPFQDGYCLNVALPNQTRLTFESDDLLPAFMYATYNYDFIGFGDKATVKTATFAGLH